MRGDPARRSVPALVALLICLAALCGLPACAGDVAPDLLNVVDVVPSAVEAGDKIEVLGANLPTGDAREAAVVFEGELRRPGQAPLRGQRIEVDRGHLAGDRVTLPLTEALQARFCGQGDEAVHTTFRGDVTVRVPSVGRGALEVKGTVEGVVIDFIPPTPRRAIAEARAKEGSRALAFLGIVAAPDAPPAGGIAVDGVREASPAARAGVLAGDVIVGFEGVRVLSVADVIPSGHERMPALEIRRGDAPPRALAVSVEGFKPSGSSDLLGAGVILGVVAGIILVFLAPTARILAWLERRVVARSRPRPGARPDARHGAGVSDPRRGAGHSGWLAEAVRALLRDEPRGDDVLHRLAPWLVFIGVSTSFVVMPFGHYLVAADLDIGVLFLIALTALTLIGLLTGGWAAGGRWSPLGALRAVAQIISYQIPAAVAVVSVVMMTGSLRVQDILTAQGGPGGSPLEVGGWPWYWFVFRSPITFALFVLYFTATLAEGGRAHASVPEAEAPGGGGLADRPGVRQALFFFAEWANVFVMCGVAGAVFLGGWQIPGVAPALQEGSLGLQVLGALLFLVKSWLLILLVVWIRWALPRVRVEQMTSLCWRWFVPLSIGAGLLTALWTVARVPQATQLAISVVTFALWGLLAIHVTLRAREGVRGLRAARAPLHLNPYL